MKESSSSDLSVASDIRLKLFSFLTGLTVFAVFAEKVINGLYYFLHIPFRLAYLIFIGIYFLLIGFVVILYDRVSKWFNPEKSINLISNRNQRNKNWSLFGPLLLLVAYWLCLPGWIYLGIGLVLCISCGVLAITALKLKIRTIRFEFISVVMVGAILLLSYIVTQPVPPTPSSKVFSYFQLRESFRKNVNVIISDLQDSAISKVKKFDSRTLMRDAVLGSSDTGWGAKALWPETLVRPVSIFDTYLRLTYDQLLAPDSVYSTGLKKSIQTCTDYIDRRIDSTQPVLNFQTALDTSFITQTGTLLKHYLFIVEAMVKRAAVSDQLLHKTVTREWVVRLRYLQYKGLIFLFALALYSFLRLNICRIQMNNLRISEYPDVKSSKQYSCLYPLIKGPVKNYADKGDAVYTQEKQRFFIKGTWFKNVSYIILLLMLPFFQNRNESNTDIDKPFLDFNLKAIVAPFNPGSMIITNDNHSYSKLAVYLGQRFNVQWIKNGDTTAVNNGIYIGAIQFGPVGIYSGDSLGLRQAIRELGRRSITDSNDRREFLNYLNKMGQ